MNKANSKWGKPADNRAAAIKTEIPVKIVDAERAYDLCNTVRVEVLIDVYDWESELTLEQQLTAIRKSIDAAIVRVKAE